MNFSMINSWIEISIQQYVVGHERVYLAEALNLTEAQVSHKRIFRFTFYELKADLFKLISEENMLVDSRKNTNPYAWLNFFDF